MTRDTATQFGKWLGGIILALVPVVGLVNYAVSASNKADAAVIEVREHETRIRDIEKTIPRIDEKLANIERLLMQHERDSRK